MQQVEFTNTVESSLSAGPAVYDLKTCGVFIYMF